MYNRYNNPDEQDLSQETLKRLKSQRGINVVGKKAVSKGARKIAQGVKVGLKFAVTTLLGILGPLVFFAGIVTLLVLMLFMGVYGGMTSESLLTSAVAKASDKEVEAYAENRAQKANIFNTWVVPGEGSWHEERLKHENNKTLFEKYAINYDTTFNYEENGEIKISNINYKGEDMPGWQFLGKLADNDGKDLQLINYWGDVYAPILFDALRDADKNLLEDEEFRDQGFQETGFYLKPYFYYKKSTITLSTENEEGEVSSTTQDIFLLVEAFTIRGHYQYYYKWKTTKSGNTTIEKEVLSDTIALDDGKKYLSSYLNKRFETNSLENDTVTATVVFEAMQGFTAKKEWTDWLLSNGTNQVKMISSISIPLEYRSYLKEANEVTGIPENVLAAIIMKESTWNPRAVNNKTGCFGLTQLNPQYWDAWAKRYGFDPVNDQWNPRVQIIVGAKVLQGYMNKQPDWAMPTWQNNSVFRAALAKYGGYGNDINGAKGYIDDIVAKANAYLQPSSFPVAGHGFNDISSPYAFRTIFGEYKFHGGIDIACPSGTAINSVSSGIVTEIGKNGQGKWGEIYGHYIEITDMNYKYLYAHLSQIHVKKGDTVMPGEVIALSGNTGRSTGAHLHFGISIINGDPKSYTNTVNPVSILQVK